MRSHPSGDHYIGFVAEPNEQANDVSIDAIENDLADVEAALTRLEAGTYWTCEVTGRPLPDDVLRANPLARRLPS